MPDHKDRFEDPKAVRRYVMAGVLVCAAIIIAAGYLGRSETVHHGSGTDRPIRLVEEGHKQIARVASAD